MSSPPKTINVPHLGGIEAAYHMPRPYDQEKATLVLINSFMTSSELFRPQFEDQQLSNIANLLAIEVLGHGSTRTNSEHFTYWDTAIMNLQVLVALGIEGKVFVLGTSQGGWIATRMALLAPEKIAGIIPLGSSMDFESPRSQELGCWDGASTHADLVSEWTSLTPTPAFTPSASFCHFLVDSGFGADSEPAIRDKWIGNVQSAYRGDEGRRRARMASLNLGSRDGLHWRLPDVKCPVLWMHGTEDSVYNVANARAEIELFRGSADASLRVVKEGHHFLSASNPEEVNEAVVDFVETYTR